MLKSRLTLLTCVLGIGNLTSITAQVDFSMYTPLPLPQVAPLLDSNFTENELVKFNAAEHSFNFLGAQEELNAVKEVLPPSDLVLGMDEFSTQAKQFSNLIPADQLGTPLTDYPFSTIVKLFITMYNPANGQLSNVSCSGAMVGANLVITAGHCVDSSTDPSYATAITVVPAYNLGSSPFGYAEMTQWYSFTQWMNNGNWDYDIAMIELNQPMGNTVGWLGWGYNMDNSFFTNQANSFHSFGYPAQDDFGNTVFEGGDRMYYMNGFMDFWESANSMCHYNIGFHGQSGSGLYQNNNGNRVVYGVLSHGDGINQPYRTCHTRLDNWMFSQFSQLVSQAEIQPNTTLEVYPNPSESGIYSLKIPEMSTGELTIRTMNGELIFSENLSAVTSLEVNLSNASSGMYLCSVTTDTKQYHVKIVK